jgi:hypothetical protein
MADPITMLIEENPHATFIGRPTLQYTYQFGSSILTRKGGRITSNLQFSVEWSKSSNPLRNVFDVVSEE